ncbi:MAG TPA: glycosyltransferase family 4 protein [Chthoniobacteraceae bacterium]|jgi:glycosyltransferase involved in cell wall biosynthesis|nr:glycosyltransferase family 4 protein [Chthoniobacteraceae bacterium]
MNPTTVLYLDHTGKLGGAEVAIARLMSSLDRSRFHPIALFGDEGAAPEMVRGFGVETHVIPLDGKVRNVVKDTLGFAAFLHPGRFFTFFTYASRIAKFAREKGVKIIHTNSLKAHLYGGLAGRLAGIPVVWHLRDFIDVTYLPLAAVRIVRFLAGRVPSHLVTDSQSVLDQLQLPKGLLKATVVRNGVTVAWNRADGEFIDCTSAAGRTQGKAIDEEVARLIASGLPKWPKEVRIGLVGRIAPWKGQHIFIQAAARLLKAGYNARFLIIGSPLFGEHEYEKSLHDMARELGIEANVEFLGFREDVSAMLRNMEILVHASTSADPCPSTVVEGMAHGLPVVGSNGGGVPEMIVDGESGLLAPMGDAESLAHAIERLLRDPALANQLGCAAYARVRRHFTLARVASQVEEVYGGMMAAAPA